MVTGRGCEGGCCGRSLREEEPNRLANAKIVDFEKWMAKMFSRGKLRRAQDGMNHKAHAGMSRRARYEKSRRVQYGGEPGTQAGKGHRAQDRMNHKTQDGKSRTPKLGWAVGLKIG